MKFIRSLFLNKRFFIALLAISALYVAGTWIVWLIVPANIILMTFAIIIMLEIIMLYGNKHGVSAKRELAEMFSNGDENPVSISIINNYSFAVDVTVIDEIPVVFQIRDFSLVKKIGAGSLMEEKYHLIPVKRGEFTFGNINVFARALWGLVERRFEFKQHSTVKVYPSFQQIKNIDFYSFASLKSPYGNKRIRQAGHNVEFEHIKNYVPGDEPRHINWKATARKNALMANYYQQERAQNIYSLIDMGRSMEMAFKGMTYLDYAINASLALGRVALKNKDRFGMLSYTNKLHQFLPAESRHNQFKLLMESLYNQKTDFRESSLEGVLNMIRNRISTRSLLIIFTNYMSRYGIERQAGYLKHLASRHLVLVVAFENTTLTDITKQEAKNLEQIYTRTIAESFMFEKNQALKELGRYGIHHLVTRPEDLTVNSINKYLEIKNRGLL